MQRATPEFGPASRFWVRPICCGLALITLLLYWPVGRYEFNNYDDAQYLTQNPHVQNGLTWESLRWAFAGAGYAGNWHPLTWISHLIDIQLFGFNAGGHHFVSLLFHVANTVLLFLLLCRWTGAVLQAAFVAGLFAWHPMHVESVAWVAERKDVLSTFFWLLTMLAYGAYVEASPAAFVPDDQTQHGKARRSYILALALFILGLLSKPMLLTLPLILLLVDYWPLRRIRFPFSVRTVTPLLVEKIPFFVLGLASCVVTFLAQKKGGAVQPLENLALADRCANAVVSYSRYLGKLFLPTDLAVLYPFTRHLPVSEILAAIGLLLVIFTAAIFLAKSHPPLLVGWFWFFITLIPVIGLVQVGEQSMADRYSYIPSIGLFILVAWGVPQWAGPRLSLLLKISAILILGACCVATRRQLGYWQNSVTLFTRATDVATNNVIAECNLGLAYGDKGQLDEAILHERKAIQINPNSTTGLNNLGIFLEKQGKWDEAAASLTAAFKVDPNYDEPYYNLGLISLQQGHIDEAISRFQKAISINPQYDKAIVNLGVALAQQGHLDEAIVQYRRAIELAPNPYAHNALGRALEERNQLGEAAAEYATAAALKPDFAEAHENLGVVLGLLGRFEESESEFAQALKLKPDSASIHFNLGNALLRENKFQAAADQYSTTIKLQPDNRQAQTNLALARKKLGQTQAAP